MLLGRNGSGGRNSVCWIDKEGDEDFTDPRPGRILETKRPNSVLVDVGESNATTLDSFDTSEVLIAFAHTGRSRWREAPLSLWKMAKRDQPTDLSYTGCAYNICHLIRGILAGKLPF